MDDENLALFWLNIYAPDGPDDCWVWCGALQDGKGRYDDGERTRYAHRVAWEAVRGEELEDDEPLVQLCKTPGCVNPAHWQRGRRGGTPPAQNVLTPEQVFWLRQKWMDGTLKRREVAEELGV